MVSFYLKTKFYLNKGVFGLIVSLAGKYSYPEITRL